MCEFDVAQTRYESKVGSLRAMRNWYVVTKLVVGRRFAVSRIINSLLLMPRGPG